jgi:hypothetical protein
MRDRLSRADARRASTAAWAACLALLWSGFVHSRDALEERVGFMECGNARITARAMCHANTASCITQTLTFSGPNARATLAPHPHKSAQRVAGARVEALDYQTASWACLTGTKSGRYLLVGLHRAQEAPCTECDYEQVYNLSGRLLVSGMTVDADGRTRKNPQGRAFIEKLKSGLHPQQLRPVFSR